MNSKVYVVILIRAVTLIFVLFPLILLFCCFLCPNTPDLTNQMCVAVQGRCLIKTNINGRESTGFGSQSRGCELSHAVKLIDNVIIQNGSNV